MQRRCPCSKKCLLQVSPGGGDPRQLEMGPKGPQTTEEEGWWDREVKRVYGAAVTENSIHVSSWPLGLSDYAEDRELTQQLLEEFPLLARNWDPRDDGRVVTGYMRLGALLECTLKLRGTRPARLTIKGTRCLELYGALLVRKYV